MERSFCPRFFKGSAISWCLLVLLAARSVAPAAAQARDSSPPQSGSSIARQTTPPQDKQITALERGKPIERELAGGQRDVFQIALSQGQLASIVVERRAIDLTLRLMARDLAATALAQRKGRVLDALVDNLGTLWKRSTAEDRTVLEQLKSDTSQLAALVLDGQQKLSIAEHQQRIRALTEQWEQLENEAARRSHGYYERTQAVTLTAIQAAMPANAVLIVRPTLGLLA